MTAFFAGCAVNHGDKFIGQPAPYTRITMLDGTYLPLEALRGKTVALFFWAQWCHRSGPIMARLNEYAQKFRDRKDVVFLAVSTDKLEDLDKLKDRILYQRLDGFQHAFSGNGGGDEAFMAFEGVNLPYLLVIDPSGKVVAAGESEQVVTDNVK